jgi:hypothetical protein
MNKPPTRTDHRRVPATYEIRLKGHLAMRWREHLDASDLTHESDGTTILHAAAADQPALHGLLQRIRDLGVPLISINQIPRQREPNKRPAFPQP